MSLFLRKVYNKAKGIFQQGSKSVKQINDEVILEGYYNAKFDISYEIEYARTKRLGNEKTTLDYFLCLLENYYIVFDIGTSVGLYSIVGLLSNKSVSFVCFEPDQEVAEKLRKNLYINGLDRAIVQQLALGNKKEKAKLYSKGLRGLSPSLKYQTERGEKAIQRTKDINTTTLDNFVEENQIVPDLLKIDIEGAEILCLEGAQNLLGGTFGKRPKKILIEVHPLFLKDYDSNPKEVMQLITQNGYEKIWEFKRNDQIHYCFEFVDTPDH